MCKTSRPKISPHPHTFVTLHKPGDHVSPVANYKPMHFKKCPASRAEPHRPFSQKPPGRVQEKLKENSSNLKNGSSIVQVKFKQNSSKIQIKIAGFQYWRGFPPAQNFKN